MNTNVTIEIDRNTASALQAQAQARGLTLGAYLRALARAEDESASNGALTPAEFDRCLDDLAADSVTLPLLPPDFGRADIYGDHD